LAENRAHHRYRHRISNVTIQSGDHQVAGWEDRRRRSQALQGESGKRIEQANAAQRDQCAPGKSEDRYPEERIFQAHSGRSSRELILRRTRARSRGRPPSRAWQGSSWSCHHHKITIIRTMEQSANPILTAHLLPKIERLLVELLRSLCPADWELQTVAPLWKVKDVAAHLLDTQLRKLSIVRDGYVPEGRAPGSPANLVAFIDELNRQGVQIYRRLSPPVLISLMEEASRQSAEYHQSLDPFAPAAFAVSWAGETTSPNWFDTAREFTERWHHQHLKPCAWRCAVSSGRLAAITTRSASSV